ncbi:phthiocerol/phthiodiolone dimycocerosyl transferase family protein [Nocardia arthritidis]|uniref:Phthiocerol/phthiodiolone dimycocerosyl transferase n=1 Tax=Nocardia arthritidis TaxID=228602 RepID=A0A6G9YLL4_9NOCA|nr:hypothetical protein [Nocardia arthritidis]QIS14030.1 hypothetical protein F5544_30935 [Nocardia arthritidis]
MTAIRFLTPTEEMFFDMGAFIGYTVCVRGSLDEQRLSDAFAVLRDRYPALRARLGLVDGRLVYAAADGPLPGISVREGDVDTPLAGFDPDPGRILSDLRVVGDGIRACVALLVHHTVADARHGLALLAQLWSLYTDRMRGEPPRSAYPESLERVLADRGVRRTDRDDNRLFTPPSGEPTPLTDGGARGHVAARARCLLSADATTTLRDIGRDRGVTVHGLVSAAIMRAHADVENVALPEISYVSAVDLRTRITPAVAPTAATDLLGYSPFHAETDTTDLVDLARGVNEQLSAQLDSGSIQIGALYTPDLAKIAPEPASRPKTGLMGTNWGVVPPLPSPDGLLIEDFRPASYRNPPSGVLSTDGVHGRQSHFISTFAGRLGIELMSYDASPGELATAEHKIAAVERHLMSLL